MLHRITVRFIHATLAAALFGAPIALLAALPLGTANAQARRNTRYQTGPDYWVGLSIGYQDGMDVYDGDTGARWQFGYTQQIRATLEKAVQPGVSIGVSAGFSNAPMTYTSGVNDANSLACGFQCSATGDITQYIAFVHGGNTGVGFHWNYDLEGGFTEFSNFKTKDSDEKIGPADGKYDFSFGLGGGVGYALSRDIDIYATEIVDFVLHPQGSNTSTSAPRVPIFRVGVRVGF
jgi:hypothetical protein